MLTEPDPIDMFSLNSINGEMTWEFSQELCHSENCNFDLEITYNGSIINAYGLSKFKVFPRK